MTKKANTFTKNKRTSQSLHADTVENKAKTKSFSIYPNDQNNIDYLASELKEFSKRKMTGAIVVRAAVTYLREQYDANKDNQKFMKMIEDLVARND